MSGPGPTGLSPLRSVETFNYNGNDCCNDDSQCMRIRNWRRGWTYKRGLAVWGRKTPIVGSGLEPLAYLGVSRVQPH